LLGKDRQQGQYPDIMSISSRGKRRILSFKLLYPIYLQYMIPPPQIEILIQNREVIKVKSTKFLGLIIDSNLSCTY
jgi:hypothetical protein